jgi:CSLREA domain-containing protein
MTRSLRSRPSLLLAAGALAIVTFLAVKAVVFASPAQYVVDSTADAVDSRAGDGVCSTVAGTCTLRAAIQEANAHPGADGIQVPSGTYELGIRPLNQNDVTTGDLDITDSVTIAGAGAGSTIVDAGAPLAGAPPQVHGLDRLFEVSVDGGTVAFSGLTISDGYAAEYGGAIANNSTATVTVDAANLTRNVAGKAGGAIDNHLGGNVEVRDSTVSSNFANESGSALNNNRGGALTVTNSTVSGNSAAAVGLDESLVGAGAIANNAELDTAGTLTVIGSQLSDNRAGGGRSGATISNDGAGTVVVEGTTFSKNRASANGGTIFNGSGQVTVADSTFTENAATDGGAIYSSADKGGFVAVRDSTFVLNTASGGGGAIVGSGSGALEVLDSTFSKNSADDWGGAVLNSNQGSATIQNVSFSENSGLNGGGFANEGNGLVTVESSTFTKNAALVTALLDSGEGGGMHSNSGGEVVVSGGSFTDNTARSGGGLSNEGGGNVAITGTRFATNTAQEQGGGILIESGAVRMLNIDVVNNVADGAEEGGGGISYAGDKAVGIGETAALEQSRIRDNKAKGPGGGIDSRGDGPLAITTTSITGNTAAVGGAVHHVGDAPLEVTRSMLSGNFAENGGGVFSDGDGEAHVVNTTISGNRAGQFGGGLLVSSRVHVLNSTVASNTAASGGGINNGGGDLIGDGFVFLRNTIVANSPTGGNCAGTMTSLGGNVDSANTCQFRELTDQPGTDPRLGPLAANGGPTQTHALLAGSPAQENAVCTELDPCPLVDQRGVERPRFDGFDSGAYESELTPGGGGGDQRCAGLTERPVLSDFDSWVSQSASGSNFGNDSILKVGSPSGGTERALVHFDLPPVPPGCKLIAATLRVYASSATEGRTLEAVRIASDWSELGVTWSNQPATAGPAATTESGLETREWDVLAQALDMYQHGDNGFLIRDIATGAGDQSFHSGEKGPEHPPELVLVFDDPNPTPLPGTCPTTPQLVSADRDSWVSEASPANNFGSDSTLKVKSQGGGNSRALIRFGLPILPAGCTSIASATLRVEAASAKEGRTLQALQLASAWTESGVTWANQPGVTGPAAAIPSASGPLEWEVTEQLLGMYTTGNHGFLIRDAAENGVGDEQTLNSRHKVTDDPPQLVLAFDDSTPETVIDAGPDAVTESVDATFSFSSDRSDANFRCSLDGAAFEVCASGHSLEGLAEGDHRFEVRATRRVRAVDPTPAVYEWKIAIPPKTTIVGPASPSDSADATVSFTADDSQATFECSLNGAAFEECTSPAEYTNLADGENVVRVRATDPLGNVEPNPPAHAWTVAVPPETTIDSGPPALGNQTSASFEFSGTDNGPAPAPLNFECRLDAGEWAACSSPQAYGTGPGEPPLADGEHVFQVRATDAAGNVGAEESYGWTVDTVAPVVSIEAGPDRLTKSTAASFEFSADEAADFECRLDAGEWEACDSPRDYTDLLDGEHTFAVRATDRAGNEGAEASYEWTVDTVAPVSRVDSGPHALTKSTAATFDFSGSDQGPAEPPLSFECRLDASDWEACSSPQEYGGEGLAALADGGHVFAVRATDGAGNVGAPASYEWMVDTVKPVASIRSGPDRLTKSTAASFVFDAADEGPAEPPLRFECSLDGGEWTSCASPQSYGAGPGEAPLEDGDHVFRVRATDGADNVSAEESYGWTVDTVAPTAAIDSGPDPLTKSTEASFVFAADETADFECKRDAGEWVACTSPQAYGAGPGEPPLPDGEHTFQVRATDGAGNLGDAASYSWTVDTVAPVASIGSGPDPLTNRTEASFGFGANEHATFECKLDSGEWMACTSPQEYGAGPGAAPLPDGDHVLLVRATDGAGNLGDAASYGWTVDTVAPVASIGSGPDRLTNRTAASFGFGADEQATFECKLDAGEWVACTSPQSYGAGPGDPPLADGEHTFEVRATDGAGNLGDSASYEWTVDTVAPVASIGAGPDRLTKSTEATFEFSGADEGPAEPPLRFECSLDGGEWTSCTSPQSYGAGPGEPALTDGEHLFMVRAGDGAGNVGEAASYEWTVDTVAPVASIDSGPDPLTKSTEASFGFGADEQATFECKLDAGEWVACTSPQSYGAGPHEPPLADGEHTFMVRATDGAGNLGEAASNAWTVDTVAPVASIGSGPDQLTNRTAASFGFGADEEASFECKLDAGEWVACTSPQAYGSGPGEPPLADGEHTFEVRATDGAGNLGEAASYEWTVDTVAPLASIGARPDRLTKSTQATFDFSGTDQGPAAPPLRFECKLDAAEWVACTSPQAYGSGPGEPPLADGEHAFLVRATDGAGNVGEAASHDWTIDTLAPFARVDSGPAALTKSTEATFVFSAGEAADFECKLDAGDWVPCSSPQSYGGAGQTPLSDGDHTFQVRATDRAGNQGGAASHSWTVDTVAPLTTITGAPSDPSTDRGPSFEFSAGEAADFECKLDAAAWEPCTSPHEYAGLADGQHTFQVRATDEAGNQGAAASYNWTIEPPRDAVAPDTSITDGPAALSNSTSASFTFTGTDNETQPSGLTFQCRLDSQAPADFGACTSPKPYTALSQGSHTFEVRAIDAAGNVDQSPAGYTWTVDSVAPVATITSGPSGPTSDSTPTFAFSSEAGASFQCRVDNAGFTNCTSPHTTAALADGAHTFEVRATDAAGNTGAAASRAFAVDTVAPQTTIGSGPAGLTNDSTPTFGFSSEAGASFQCRVDAAAFAACTSPHTTGALSDGAYTFEVRATDAAGNTDASPASRAITVDTAAPQTTITTAPPATTTSTSASFHFNSSETGSAFECSLDGAAFAACTSPRDYSGLAVGSHQFSVRARDTAGNPDGTPATHSWTITAPQQGCGSPVTALAAADAWIDENSPTNNKGTDSILKVQSKGPRDNFRALVRFTLPAVPQGCAVESATLRLYSPSAKTPRTIHALRLASAWSENLVNWSNQPLTIGPAAATAAGTGYREWSVTSQVQAMYVEANHGFLIRDSVEGQDAEQQFHSREKGENPPQLVIRYAAGGP